MRTDALGLTRERQKKISRVAFERMANECESDFSFLEQFRTHGVCRFLLWIRTIEKSQRLEAALAITCAQLRLRHVECEEVANFEHWVKQHRETPLKLGLDPKWKPRQYAKEIVNLVHAKLGPLSSSTQSPDFAEGSPFSISQVRGGLELNTRIADIVLLQFLQGDRSLFDLSYVSVLGLGQTGWKLYSEADCARAEQQLPAVIEKVKELV